MGQRVSLCLGWGLGWSRFFCADETRVWSRSKQIQRAEKELALLSFCGNEKCNEALYRPPPCVYVAVRGKSSQPYSSSSPHFSRANIRTEKRTETILQPAGFLLESNTDQKPLFLLLFFPKLTLLHVHTFSSTLHFLFDF